MKYIPTIPMLLLCSGLNAATIFECESMAQGRFYSTGDCALNRAVIVTRHTVPDGMSFEQQVAHIDQGKATRTSVQAAANQTYAKNQQCAGIDQELNRLQTKYTNWQYVPIDEVNADQAKERDLRSKRSSLGCATR